MQYRDPSTRKTKTALEASNVTLVPLVTAVTIHPGGATPVQLTVARGTQACDWGGGGKSDSQDLFMVKSKRKEKNYVSRLSCDRVLFRILYSRNFNKTEH